MDKSKDSQKHKMWWKTKRSCSWSCRQSWKNGNSKTYQCRSRKEINFRCSTFCLRLRWWSSSICFACTPRRKKRKQSSDMFARPIHAKAKENKWIKLLHHPCWLIGCTLRTRMKKQSPRSHELSQWMINKIYTCGGGFSFERCSNGC